ncbi:MAG TPA: 50S ribosomal protein L34e [Candidatus Altiarchaeales archaeon]|nr:50S ribosomal protein L34e [Candidatus Altiarchaeales archaeon]
MVRPQLRSRSVKKVKCRTPGGRIVIHYRKEKPSKHVCGRCGRLLSGVPNDIPSKVRKLSKTEKRPSRAYAGVLCSNCVEELLRYQTRFEAKFKYPGFEDINFERDLTLEKFLPRGWYKSLVEGKR